MSTRTPPIIELRGTGEILVRIRPSRSAARGAPARVRCGRAFPTRAATRQCGRCAAKAAALTTGSLAVAMNPLFSVSTKLHEEESGPWPHPDAPPLPHARGPTGKRDGAMLRDAGECFPVKLPLTSGARGSMRRVRGPRGSNGPPPSLALRARLTQLCDLAPLQFQAKRGVRVFPSTVAAQGEARRNELGLTLDHLAHRVIDWDRVVGALESACREDLMAQLHRPGPGFRRRVIRARAAAGLRKAIDFVNTLAQDLAPSSPAPPFVVWARSVPTRGIVNIKAIGRGAPGPGPPSP